MLCINCFTSETRVTNSRPSKKEPRIWRRRQCLNCKYVFTTKETVAIEDNLKIDGQPFSIYRLAWSLSPHIKETDTSAETAYWIAQSVAQEIIKMQNHDIKIKLLKNTTHKVLSLYNPGFGMSYALSHNIIRPVATSRRGRPSLKRTEA